MARWTAAAVFPTLIPMMIVHSTRHGQVLPAGNESWSHADYPSGDGPLSELGQQQATWLGQHLKTLSFNGSIFSSPYRRTVETACAIAAVVDTVVQPAAPLREIVKRVEQLERFVGLSADGLRNLHTRVEPAKDFEDVWWTPQAEDDDGVEARVAPFVDTLIDQDSTDVDRHVLLVGHGASTGGVIRHLLRRSAPELIGPPDPGWNCALTSFCCHGVDGPSELIRLMETDHLPEDAVTSNAQSRADVLAARRSD